MHSPSPLAACSCPVPAPTCAAPGNDGWQLPAALRSGYDKAQHAAELRQPYETSVGGGRQADADMLAAYMAYIKVEERQGDPSRVQVGLSWGGGPRLPAVAPRCCVPGGTPAHCVCATHDGGVTA